uniref:[heparan sulfate]-glucosamine N-sulfotransferase n=1 Tax=Meloidogyne incognita TaxID=6306 RepID=A0A914KZT8_MELIC
MKRIRKKFFKSFYIQCLLWTLIYSTLIFIYFAFIRFNTWPKQQTFHYRRIIPDYNCTCNKNIKKSTVNSIPRFFNFSSFSPKNATQRILFLSDSVKKSQIYNFFVQFKVPVRLEQHLAGDILLLELNGIPRFSLIVFENFLTFDNLPNEQKELLNNFSKKYSVGIISFFELDIGKRTRKNFGEFEAFGGLEIKTVSFSSNSPIRKIGKDGCEYSFSETEQTGWTLFRGALPNSIPLLEATTSEGDIFYPAFIFNDGIHAIFGAKPEHWMVYIALLDTINYFAPNIYSEDLERFIQIDIDDVFVGASGSLFTANDIRALINLQEELRNSIDNFTFSLGFSGYFFRHGSDAEIEGNDFLVANAKNFNWFPHMWRHNHAHEHSSDYLLALMAQNKFFAENYGIPTKLSYAIAPIHSGVYPVYQPLFDGWKRMWNISVTSTEEYPHYSPSSQRRGFIYGNISVLPRQTCGLFTHTHYFHAYPGGINNFLNGIYGGAVFKTLLLNKFSIFMTHQQNFANDRLGFFTFLNLIKFVKCWTNLKLRWIEPVEMAKRYFEKFKGEETLFYTNFCTDKRHIRMLPVTTSCDKFQHLPNLIILGPQKTGTTALSMFLQIHPNISTNLPIPGYFEELQFFASQNYNKGIDWYVENFISNESSLPSLIRFEKSANYFDNPKAPAAISALLPNAKLIVVFSDPVRRAFSWYKHMQAKNDSVTLKYSADEVFIGNFTETDHLKRRSLLPGLYAQHLENWFDFFPPSNFLFVDGDKLRNEPYLVLRDLFNKLELPIVDNLSNRLKFSQKKGFYCIVLDNKSSLHCLGISKGRRYEPMTERLKNYLEAFYSEPNKSLKDFLNKYKIPLPSFLIN